MHQQPTPEQIQERFSSLPKDLQNAITSNTVTENMQAIGEKYKLRLDKTGLMIQEVGMIMLGFEKTAEFVHNLQTKLEVDRETAESIAVDVDTQVFEGIRSSLREVQLGEHGEQHHDQEHGTSPVRDSLIRDIERNAAPVETFTSGTDYSPNMFGSSKSTAVSGQAWAPEDVPSEDKPLSQTYADVVPLTPPPTPYEAHISEEEKIDPTKSFQDHLKKKISVVKEQLSADPYREPIE